MTNNYSLAKDWGRLQVAQQLGTAGRGENTYVFLLQQVGPIYLLKADKAPRPT